MTDRTPKQQQPLSHDNTSGSDDTDSRTTAIKLPEIKTAAAAVADTADGPTTPMSPNSRIPVNVPCPPAPKKMKSHPICNRKRSADSDSNSSRLLDFCKEAESMFSSPIKDHHHIARKLKKARSL